MDTRKGRVPLLALCVLLLSSFLGFAQEAKYYSPAASKPIPAGSTIFVAPILGGFDTYVTAGIMKKKVPLTVVADRSMADYEVTGVAESDKAGWAKMLFLGSGASREQASIKVVDLKTGEVVFAYSVHKFNSARGKQSAGEACAKHLKDKIEAK
jgi:hypothetical protein